MKHKGQIFHNEIEMPHDHSVHLPLSMATAIDEGSVHFNLGATVEPLLTQHCNERGEEGGRQTGVKDRLDVNHSRVRTAPLREGGS